MTIFDMNQEKLSDEYWLDKLFRKSESIRTLNVARTSLSTFDFFYQNEVGLNGKSKEVMIQKYHDWMNQDKPDVRSVCMSLVKFVNFMTKDHDDVYVYTYSTFKAKASKTIKLYFRFVKSYLRICHGIKPKKKTPKRFSKGRSCDSSFRD